MHAEMTNLIRISPQQKHLWLQQKDNYQAYCSQIAINIGGNLNPDILKLALANISDRHEIFRTAFHSLPGMNIPLQSISDAPKRAAKGDRSTISLGEYDWSSLTSQVQQAKIDALFQDQSLRVFDFEQAASLHFILSKLAPDKHILFISLPALYADITTLNNLICEIGRSYTACLHGEELSDEAMQYADISEWLNELLESEETETARTYWHQQDISSVLNLRIPFESKNVNQSSGEIVFVPQSLFLKVNRDTVEKLEILQENYHTSTETILLACWQVLLWRLSGQSDIVIGTAGDGREYDELKEVLGLLTKYLPTHSHLENTLKFSELIEKVSESFRFAKQWQEYFDWEHLTATNDKFASRAFFPFCFDFTKQSQSYVNADISFSEYKKSANIEKYQIKLSSGYSQNNLFLNFDYDSSLFSEASIKTIAGQYLTLIESVTHNPEAAIIDLNMIGESDRQKLLIDFNNTKTEFSQDKCIHQLFAEQVERTPDNIAVEFNNEHLTYAQLNAKSNQLAHQLQKLGVKPEVLVGICVERSLDMLIGILGILKAGGAYIPFDPTYPQERLGFMLEDAQIPILLTQQRLVDKFVEHNTRLICLDRDLPENAILSIENPVSEVTPENLAYIIYTSGSTGKPKGTMIPHRGLVNYLSWSTNAYAIAQGYGAPVQSSIGFDATITSLFSPLLVGQRVVLLPEKEEIEALSALLQSDKNYSLVKITPAHLEMLNQMLPNHEGVTKTRALIIGGEALLGKSLKFWRDNAPNTRIINEYGPTETVVGCCVYEVSEQTSLSGAILIGRPIANTQLYLLDKNQKLVPIGVPGELYIGGAGVARGYLNRPELTQQRFIPNPFSDEPNSRLYKTGDLARYLPDGNIEYLGRIDHQVKIRGFRIELEEIESLLAQHPLVNSVTVIAREDQPGDKRLVGYIVPQEQAPTSSELRQFLQKKLPEYMIPSAFLMLEVIPLTAHAKVDRQALPQPDTSRLGTLKTEFLAPQNDLEQKLANIWENLLNVHPVGVKDNFFDLGGHSLLAVRLMAHLNQEFGKNLSLATLFQNPTIEKLANILRLETEILSWSALVEIQKGNSKYPFFCLPGGGGNVLYLHNLARYLGENQTFYGLQAPGLNGESEPLICVEDMAAYYIQAIKTVQPEGPYFLGGHSFGGIVAYEMAQQLIKSGNEVALVAILDAPAPVASDKPLYIDVDDATRLTETARLIERWAGKNLDISYEILQPLELDEQLEYLKERLITVDLLPAGTDTKQVRGLVQVFEANLQASIKYLPQEAYPNRLTLLRASEVNAEDAALLTDLREDPAWGWGQFSAQNIDILVVPGDHITMMAQPHILTVAEQLGICIEQANVGK
ncbi:amino acid adenylation domain-containing protein [Nostoc sp. DedSLP04]|uniref:non-ribosomal peptide synthetase n=1 Tax=Nostoc sp. DedSLP04 TaxID=3075401 RepID=UPI002AD4A2DD|nr:amino acid adenylation domain-containing protein [Nostoc sp. DedSLP04]MDZ8034723.1 amino acid adenylation domain-containing protein [Nostoc sp. DedSLP04]